MQVERGQGATPESSGERVSNAWVIYLEVGDNLGKLGLIPHTFPGLRLREERWPLLASYLSQRGPRLIS